MNWRSVFYACCAMWVAGTVQAAAVFSVETVTGPPAAGGSPFSPLHPAGGPSSTDLLAGALPIAQSGNFQQEASTGVSALTNGSIDTFYGTGVGSDDHTGYATGDASGGGQFVTYDLGGLFNLSSIVTFGGWGDGGRDQQLYEILTSTDGINFNTLASFAGVNVSGTTPISHRVALTEDALPHLATGVTHVRVNFLDVENDYTGYTEIDVLGARVPEPASAVLAGLGALSILGIRRRR
jgi:hypothetical protein